MRLIPALALTMTLGAVPLAAQEALPAPDDAPEDDGFSLMEEGARLVLRGLMTEMEPALDGMAEALTEVQPALQELGPKLQELLTLMGDVTAYGAPEILPNGDILIRRTRPLPDAERAPDPVLPLPGPDGEIEL